MPRQIPVVVTVPYEDYGLWWLFVWAVRIVCIAVVIMIAIPFLILWLIAKGITTWLLR